MYETDIRKKDDNKCSPGATIIVTPDEKKPLIGNDLRTDKIEIWDLENGVADFGFLREVSGRQTLPFDSNNTDILIHGYNRNETLMLKSMTDGNSTNVGKEYPLLQRVSVTLFL